MKRIEKSAECLSLEKLADYAAQELSSEPRQQVQEHLDGCPACRTELALLGEFESPSLSPAQEADMAWMTARLKRTASTAEGSAETAAASPDAPRHPSRPRVEPAAARSEPVVQPGLWQRLFNVPMLPAAGLAASLLLAAAALFLMWPGSGQLPLAPQGSVDVLRSDVIVLRPLDGPPASAPQALAWETVPGAASYRVVILKVDRAPLWQQETEGLSVEIPQHVRQEMSPARRFLWQVAAYSAQGEQVAVSEAAPIVIQARQQ